jgi:ornithine carbamoyltransferase
MALANPGLHGAALPPAHRGEEITAEVFEAHADERSSTRQKKTGSTPRWRSHVPAHGR